MADSPSIGAPGPLPTAEGAREAQAHREVGRTDVAPATARLLVAAFVATIVTVPVVEWLGARTRGAESAGPSWSRLSALPAEIRAARAALPADAGRWSHVVAANRRVLAAIDEFENALEDESVLGRRLRPPAQQLLTGWLGAGNERVYPGVARWLFYRPDVEYVTGRPFLETRTLARRASSAAEWERAPAPDPRPAIARFRADLAARGIALVLVPTPVKPSVQPASLASRFRQVEGAVQNPSFDALVADLRAEGTLVFDPGAALAGAARSDPQYLETDTHWRPGAMEEVATLLARFIESHVPLPRLERPGHRIERVEVRNTGDTARMLDLPADSALFPPERVWLRRVLRADGSSWRSSREADVLVLGDSFSNIYALESMGWGTSAGLVEQLSDALGRPLDRIVQNDEGAFATRAQLAEQPARLAGKRLVVYQFAAREFAFGEWRVIATPQ